MHETGAERVPFFLGQHDPSAKLLQNPSAKLYNKQPILYCENHPSFPSIVIIFICHVLIFMP